MKHRKITHIVGASNQSGAIVTQAYALCDDGSVWKLVVNTVMNSEQWLPLDVSAVETAAIGGR